MRPPPEMIPVLIDTARTLKASRRRLFMARTVHAMGRGGQRWAEEHLGWSRVTIRKGMRELHSGMTCLDAFSARGRRPVEGRLPRLLDDIKDIADGQSQADPRFQTDRLFTRISAAEVRRQFPAAICAAGRGRSARPRPIQKNHVRRSSSQRPVPKCRRPVPLKF